MIEMPAILYHGTSLNNLKGILSAGQLSPGKGYSPHRTKTKNALFYTPDAATALVYADQYEPVILSLPSELLPDLQPDYDDAGVILSVDLMELQEAFNDEGIDINVELGMTIPEEHLDFVYRHLDNPGYGERDLPVSLTLVEDKLLADPIVRVYIDESKRDECPDAYYEDSDLLWSENQPFMLSRQYMSYLELPADAITYWLPAVTLKLLGKRPSQRKMKITDYSKAYCSGLSLFRERIFYGFDSENLQIRIGRNTLPKYPDRL